MIFSTILPLLWDLGKEDTLMLETGRRHWRGSYCFCPMAWCSTVSPSPTQVAVFSHTDALLSMSASLIDLFSSQSGLPGLLCFLFTSSLISPSTHRPSCKSHVSYWTFYFVPPSSNYCLVIILSIHINLIFVSSPKLLEDAECSQVTAIFFTNSTSLSYPWRLNNIE